MEFLEQEIDDNLFPTDVSCFGTTYANRSVFVKRFQESHQHNFRKEAIISKYLSEVTEAVPSVVTAGFSRSPSGTCMYLMLDLCDGDLSSVHRISEQEAFSITLEICLSLQSIHRVGIVHRDIKPENILIKQGRLLIGDFGLSTFALNRLLKTKCGSHSFVSPDVLVGTRGYSGFSADVWSIGILLFTLLTDSHPWAAPLGADFERFSSDPPQFLRSFGLSDRSLELLVSILVERVSLALLVDKLESSLLPFSTFSFSQPVGISSVCTSPSLSQQNTRSRFSLSLTSSEALERLLAKFASMSVPVSMLMPNTLSFLTVDRNKIPLSGFAHVLQIDMGQSLLIFTRTRGNVPEFETLSSTLGS